MSYGGAAEAKRKTKPNRDVKRGEVEIPEIEGSTHSLSPSIATSLVFTRCTGWFGHLPFPSLPPNPILSIYRI